MSLKEFMEWVQYYEVEPWGSEISGVRSAVNTSAIYNSGLMMADPKRLRTKPFQPKDFYVGIVDKKAKTRTLKGDKVWQEHRRHAHAMFSLVNKKKDND
jgi:hypothetical protein